MALLIRTALAAAAITALSIWILDGPIAAAMSSVSPEAKRLVTKGVQLCEWLFGFRISPYLYSSLLILGGLALRLRNRVTFGRWLIFIGLAQAPPG